MRSSLAGTAGEGPAWSQLRRGFLAVAGSPRLLLYDLERQDAPARLSRSGIAVRSSARWRAYLARRRELDDGQLSLVIALRRLERAERLLAVDWGTAHANTFLLIEPLDPGIDLVSPADPTARILREAAERAETARVEALLRSLYGSWVYWPDAPAAEDGCAEIELSLGQGGATLFECLQPALRRAFPPSAFHERLKSLLAHESELFTGRTVERARSPFLTRLGLPAVYEPSLVTGAVRRLVNEGRLSAFAAGGHGFFQGPADPVPEDVPNELFERMVL